MKEMKKWLTGFLVAVVVLTSVPLGQVQASEAAAPEVQSATMESEASQIESITAKDLSFIEYTNGYYTKDYNPETREYDLEWYRYSFSPTFTVTYKDGRVETGSGGITIDGQWYSPRYKDDQSYEKQWGVGKHTVTAEIAGTVVTFTVEIVESPIESIAVGDMNITEYTNGYYTTSYNPETGKSDLEWYRYDLYNRLRPTFTVTYKDGRVVTGSGGITIDGQWYSCSYADDQSYENQWGIGKHTVTASLAGKETTFTVEIVENQIESIVAEDVCITEYTSGYFTTAYNSETGKYDLEWYRYNYYPTFIITYKDGHVERGSGAVNMSGSIDINGESYTPSYVDDQSYESQWSVGKHTVTAKIAEKETTFTVEMVENPIESIVAQDVSIQEFTKGYYTGEYDPIMGNKRYYRYYDFSPMFIVTYKDGSMRMAEGLVSINGEGYTPSYENDQSYENQWGVGKHTVTAKIAGMKVPFTVEIQKKPEFEYVEQDDGLYITYCALPDETIEIPEEINGKTVVGIDSLGWSARTVKNLIIPDTVKSIGAEAFNDWDTSVETIYIGSGVTHLDVDIFGLCSNLESIKVSENNPYYCDVDGVVYDKTKETLVVYPRAKGTEYNVPATVTNIDILNADIYSDLNITFAKGSAYVTEDGITYSADRTKVIFCSPDKTGSYVMPNTVTKIAEGAFKRSQLTEVKFSNNVTEIIYETFADCTLLSNVELPKNLKLIGTRAFDGCYSLETIGFPSGLKSIGDAAFCNTSLKEVNIPDSVDEIGGSAFSYSPITRLDLGQGVKTIATYAFYGTNIESLIIPASVTDIGGYAFSEIRIESLVIPENVKRIDMGAFSDCKNLRRVEINNENISAESLFSNCPIEELTLKNVKGKVGKWTFTGAELKDLYLPDGVTEVAYAAFANNTDLATIDVPESLVRVNGAAFENTAWEKAQEDGPVYLEHIFYEYKGAMPDNTDLIIKDGTTVLADFSLRNCNKLSNVTLPEGLKTIGSVAFFGNTNIRTIRIPASVSFIGKEAFANCDSLTAIDVDPANKYYSSVDGVLFNKDGTELIWCPKRSSDIYEVPSTVKLIKEGAFGSSGVTNIKIRNENVVLEKYSIGYQCDLFFEDDPRFYRYNYVTLHCVEGSTAYKYAKDNLLDVNLLVPITDVTLEQTQVDLVKGNNTTLTATINPSDTTDDKILSWASSNESVVRVGKETANGVEIEAVGAGTATITVTTVNGKTASCVIKVAQWVRDSKGWWYCRADGTYPSNGWYEIEDEWYYFNASGYCLENQWIGNCYVKVGGAMAKNQWVGNYYVGENGVYISNARWLQLGETWYYLGAGGVRQTGWQLISGTWYYFNGSGAMQIGWQAIGGTWYYLDENGAMLTGWQLISGTWYYLSGSGAMLTGWQAIGGTWYYLNGSGAMLTGWQTIGGTWYYLNENGAMLTGWQAIGGTWYYFNGSGAMVASQWVGNYYLQADGSMATNKWIDSYYVDANGLWNPNK